MLSDILSFVTSFVIQTISGLGYGGVFLLMLFESAAIPIPSEVVLPFSGYLVSEGRFTLSAIAITAGLGSMVGSMVTYGVGKYGGRRFLKRYGHYVLMSQEDLKASNLFFKRFGLSAVFFGRLIPIVRMFVSIPAGIAHVPFGPFLFYSFAGTVLWAYALGYLGFRLGPEWVLLRARFHWVDYVVLSMLFAALVLVIFRRVRRK